MKSFLTIIFLLATGLCFANRRTLMGFDILSMGVPVMQPTLSQNGKFLMDAWAYKSTLPVKGDIAVHSFSGQQGLYVNRIIATEYDCIEIVNGRVFLNGKKLNEPYLLASNVTRPESRNMKAVVVPQGHVFVMGDNRDASFGDSRFNGTISRSNICGKVTDIIEPAGKTDVKRYF